jgi:hypothetical protein
VSNFSNCSLSPFFCCGKSKSSPGDFQHPPPGTFFSNCFALPAALGIPSPASGISGRKSKMSGGKIDLQAAKQIPFMRLRIVSEIWILSAASRKESLEISNFGRIFPAAGRRSKARLKIALFGGFLEVVGGISALSPEMRIVSRKFKRIAGNPRKSLNFSGRARSFKSSAELLNFQPEIRKFG